MKSKSGLGIRGRTEHRDANGKVISIQDSTFKWPEYQVWRAKWCEKHRNAWAISGFREGKINPLTLGFALFQYPITKLGG